MFVGGLTYDEFSELTNFFLDNVALYQKRIVDLLVEDRAEEATLFAKSVRLVDETIKDVWALHPEEYCDFASLFSLHLNRELDDSVRFLAEQLFTYLAWGHTGLEPVYDIEARCAKRAGIMFSTRSKHKIAIFNRI